MMLRISTKAMNRDFPPRRRSSPSMRLNLKWEIESGLTTSRYKTESRLQQSQTTKLWTWLMLSILLTGALRQETKLCRLWRMPAKSPFQTLTSRLRESMAARWAMGLTRQEVKSKTTIAKQSSRCKQIKSGRMTRLRGERLFIRKTRQMAMRNLCTWLMVSSAGKFKSRAKVSSTLSIHRDAYTIC